MDGSKKIIEFLNEALTSELTAINQYFAHSKICESWGWTAIAAKFREEAIDEMRDAESLMDRILFLDGLPNLQRLGGVSIGETVSEQLNLDAKLETDSIAMYQRGITLALKSGDAGTRELLERLLSGEEAHLDWLETQQNVIEKHRPGSVLAGPAHRRLVKHLGSMPTPVWRSTHHSNHFPTMPTVPPNHSGHCRVSSRPVLQIKVFRTFAKIS